VKRASITEAKNQLSALVDRVRHGERVVIEDRGVPVAMLDPVLGLPEEDEGRVARLERGGLARRPEALLSRTVLRTPPPRPSCGARLSQAAIDERAEGR
jgi:prevent-host-death family protein